MHEVLRKNVHVIYSLEPDRRVKSDVILRHALDETLGVFGESNKRMLLYAFGVGNTDDGINTRDAEGYLEFDKVAQNMKRVLGEKAAEMILEQVMIKMDELYSANFYVI